MRLRPIPLQATRLAGLLAGSWFAVALCLFAAHAPGYRHALQPPALLGAGGMPDAWAWNLIGFIVPGALALSSLHGVHGRLRDACAGRAPRVGATLLQLSAIAFAAQGLVSLQLGQAVDAGEARLHIAAWMSWWLAAVAGFALLGVGGWRRQARLARSALAAAIVMLLVLQTDVLPFASGTRERLALAAWFGWIAVASVGRGVSRSAVSSPG